MIGWMLLAGLACGELTYTDDGTTGTGTLAVVPEVLSFQPLHVNETSSAEILLRNIGDGPLHVYDVAFSDDTRRPHWTLRGGRSGLLEPGEKSYLEVDLHPRDLTDPDVSLVVLTDDPERPEVQIPLQATVEGVPDIRLEPVQLSFGRVSVSGERVVKDVTLANDGSADLDILAVGLAESSRDFLILISPAGSSLPPLSDNGLLSIEFSPEDVGTVTAEIIISSNDPDEPRRSLILTGQGVP